MGGNIILGVGPKPDGTLPNEAFTILEPLGKWLDQFGEGIYETRPVHFKVAEGWYFTQKGATYYAFHEKGQTNPLVIEALPFAVHKVTDLNTGQASNLDTINQNLCHEDLYQVYKIE